MKHSDIFSFDVARATPADLRQVFRSGAFTGNTGGMALGRLQGNLAIVPSAQALDFARFCQRNPRPCPLIGISDTGNPDLWMLGDGIDVRTDLPNYYVYRNGVLEGERTDIAVDTVFIGACTNSRIEDMRAAAAVATGRHATVRTLVVPGSGLVKKQAEAEGLDLIFVAAGMEWREPGCSMCVAMNGDILAPGERAASTSNRNFRGRQGLGSRTHLVSPAMAAAASVAGHFTDVRKLTEGE